MLFSFCPDFLIMQENALIRKLRLIPKFTDWATNSYNTNIVQYLKRKRNHTMEFDQLIENNI